MEDFISLENSEKGTSQFFWFVQVFQYYENGGHSSFYGMFFEAARNLQSLKI